MVADFPSLRVLFLDAMHNCVSVDYLRAQVNYSKNCIEKTHYLSLWALGTYEWLGYFGHENQHITEAHTSSWDHGQVGAS